MSICGNIPDYLQMIISSSTAAPQTANRTRVSQRKQESKEEKERTGEEEALAAQEGEGQ